MSASTATLFSFFLLLSSITLSSAVENENGNNTAVVEVMKMMPLIEPGKGEIILNESRRKLSSFQICSLCTCCGGANNGYCVPSPCCYTINCNIPNRPFGFCSFTPKSCNCFGCHL